MDAVGIVIEAGKIVSSRTNSRPYTRKWLPSVERMLKRGTAEEILATIDACLRTPEDKAMFHKWGMRHVEFQFDRIRGQWRTEAILKGLAVQGQPANEQDWRRVAAEAAGNPALSKRLRKILGLSGCPEPLLNELAPQPEQEEDDIPFV